MTTEVGTHPSYKERKIEDGVKVKKGKNKVLQHLNKQHGRIQFTMEMENSGSLLFMDIRITRQPQGELTKEVYQKPTQTNCYIPFRWHHISVKSGVVACLANRAIRVSSSQAGEDAELGRIQKVMMRNGYPRKFINKVVSSQIKRHTTSCALKRQK